MYNKAGIDEKKIRNSVFLSPDAKKVLTPEPVMHTITAEKEEIMVSYKVGTKLKAIRKAIEGRSCYAAESCPEHILTSEEVADREDPNRNSDAFTFTEPELDEEKVTPLAMGEKLDRYAWFVAVCNRVSEPDVLTYILENVPRKKNGLLAKGKPVVVAALPIVFTAQMGYYEIVGKVKSETAFELALQERKFSEEEWMLTRDNVYLRFLETGKRPILTDVKLTKVKLWHIRNGNKTTIEIPAIQLNSGKLAIAAMPYRPISDFSSVRGDDKKGYEILEPENLPRKTVCSNGITTNFVFDVQNSSLGIWTQWTYLEEPAKYIRTGKKTYKMRTEIFTGSPRNGKIFERCLSENYIAEIAYQLLCAVDGVNELLGDPEFFADAAARAKRKKNGSLCANGGCDIPARCAPGRELPLVTGYVRLLNESATDTIRVTYGISHRLGDDWSEYQEP